VGMDGAASSLLDFSTPSGARSSGSFLWQRAAELTSLREAVLFHVAAIPAAAWAHVARLRRHVPRVMHLVDRLRTSLSRRRRPGRSPRLRARGDAPACARDELHAMRRAASIGWRCPRTTERAWCGVEGARRSVGEVAEHETRLVLLAGSPSPVRRCCRPRVGHQPRGAAGCPWSPPGRARTSPRRRVIAP